MPAIARPTAKPALDDDILAVVRALAKRRALLDHEAEVARIKALSQTRAAAQQA